MSAQRRDEIPANPVPPVRNRDWQRHSLHASQLRGRWQSRKCGFPLPQPILALEDIFLHSSADLVTPEWFLQLSLSLPRLSKCFLLSFLLFANSIVSQWQVDWHPRSSFQHPYHGPHFYFPSLPLFFPIVSQSCVSSENSGLVF